MYVCIYVSNIFTHVWRTLVPEICICPERLRVCPEMLRVCPEILCVFWYIDVLACVIYNRKQGRLELLQRRQVGECADTDMV